MSVFPMIERGLTENNGENSLLFPLYSLGVVKNCQKGENVAECQESEVYDRY